MGNKAANLQQSSSKSVIEVIIALLGLFITFVVLLKNQGLILPYFSPQFTMRDERTGEHQPFSYEITRPLISSDLITSVPDDFSFFNLIFEARYEGNEYNGPVAIFLVNGIENELKIGEWENFHDKHQNLKAKISVRQLAKLLDEGANHNQQFEYVDPVHPSIRIYSVPIEIRYYKEVLWNSTINFAFQPWNHTITDALLRNGTLSFNTTVNNFYREDHLAFEFYLYDITDDNLNDLLSSETIIRKLSPIYTWSRITPNTVKVNGNFSFSLDVNIEQLITSGHRYLLEAYWIKELPYLDFSPDKWYNSQERWRCRDKPNFLVIDY